MGNGFLFLDMTSCGQMQRRLLGGLCSFFPFFLFNRKEVRRLDKSTMLANREEKFV